MDQLKTICESIKCDLKDDMSEDGLKIFCSASKILELACGCQRSLKKIESFAGSYDIDQFTPYNGYRSFLSIFESFITQAVKVCANIDDNYGKFYFWKSRNAIEIFVISEMMQNLHVIGLNLIKMHEIADEGKLFAKRCHPDNILTRAYSEINQEYFYGRFAGFHFVEPLRNFVKYLTLSMASYAEFYDSSDQGIFSRMFHLSKASRKYLVNPELCASRIIEMANSDVHVLSNFMRLVDSRFVQTCLDITAKKLATAETFQIYPEKLRVQSADMKTLIDAPIPQSQIGVKAIKCRLLSSRKRDGMIGTTYDCTASNIESSSDSIIIHAHGGGWISQSARSHEVYLRDWAIKLDVPILSVDYSLAPEVTFPRAIEEVLYVYCWVLKYGELVGTTGQKIIFAGDSAGGNIMTAVLIRVIEMGLPKPNGLFAAYTPFLLNYVKSPSRFIGYMDPFLNVSAIIKIFNCYCNGRPLNDSESSEISDKVDVKLRNVFCEIDKNYLMSPMLAPDEILRKFPPIRLLSINTDPCLDDSIEFCRRLRSLEVDTRINVLEGLCHGFLNLVQICKDNQKGSMKCIEIIDDLLKSK